MNGGADLLRNWSGVLFGYKNECIFLARACVVAFLTFLNHFVSGLKKQVNKIKH